MALARDYASSKEPEVHFLEPSRTDSSQSTTGSFKPRPRSNSHHLSTVKPPSRRWLFAQARTWRFLMSLGMFLHDVRPPKPPKPSFVKHISTLPTGSRPISLYFYTPKDYRSRVLEGHKYPVVVNFHGGGFCLGNPLDDRYWAASITGNMPAVFVSVGYRLAPEHPFPTAVDDCVDALLYLSTHHEDLGLNTSQIALSGFSAGANLAFTVPLRLRYHTRRIESSQTAPRDNEDLLRWPFTQSLLESSRDHPLNIVSIAAWYPLLDWSESRASKTRHSVKPEKALPKFFTTLFDHSYLPSPDMKGNHASPYASPAIAPDEMLLGGLPSNIQMYLCEWDMLLHEGQVFSEKLESLDKDVHTRIIPRVPHGWDKSPSPFRDQAAINALYAQACAGIMQSFGQDPSPLHRRFSLERASSSVPGTLALSRTQRPNRASVAQNVPL